MMLSELGAGVGLNSQGDGRRQRRRSGGFGRSSKATDWKVPDVGEPHGGSTREVEEARWCAGMIDCRKTWRYTAAGALVHCGWLPKGLSPPQMCGQAT